MKPKIKKFAGAAGSKVMPIERKQAFVRRIPASQDGSTLIQALDESFTTLSRILATQGSEGESERVQLSLQALDFIATAEAEASGRKILIWISPGWPLLAQSNAKTRAQLFDTIVYFSNLLRNARITLDAVSPEGISGGMVSTWAGPQCSMVNGIAQCSPLSVPMGEAGPSLYENYFKAVSTAKQADANHLALQVLAHQSGGLVLDRTNAIEAQIARCAAEAGVFYVLAYDLPATSRSNQYHEIQIRMTKPGLVARTRAGFYSQ